MYKNLTLFGLVIIIFLLFQINHNLINSNNSDYFIHKLSKKELLVLLNKPIQKGLISENNTYTDSKGKTIELNGIKINKVKVNDNKSKLYLELELDCIDQNNIIAASVLTKNEYNEYSGQFWLNLNKKLQSNPSTSYFPPTIQWIISPW